MHNFIFVYPGNIIIRKITYFVEKKSKNWQHWYFHFLKKLFHFALKKVIGSISRSKTLIESNLEKCYIWQHCC